ncbi:hypothetical protein NC652_003385 [Populus alba x Populus x berolinensis]|nr:hypothetical protein NC652_003385 [Populus alba x Populus x berolinensis]
MGFLLAANGLSMLYININVFKLYYGDERKGLFKFDGPRNLVVIADNVGDMTGMGFDIFSSYAQFYCVALVVASIPFFGINHESTLMLYHRIVSYLDVADSCQIGAANINVIFGLALGYKSIIILIFVIIVNIFVSFSFAAMYGIVVTALGISSTIATRLVIDAYGPISDNAGGIDEMADMIHKI